MQALIVFCTILGVTFGAPFGKSYSSLPALPAPEMLYHVSEPVKQVRYIAEVHSAPTITGNLYNTQDTYGQYKYGYSSSDGQAKTEHRLVDGGVSGQFSYMSPEGKPITLSYIADEDGFRPTGDHLPVAPEALEMPADLAEAYRVANERLRKAHEEASLRETTTEIKDEKKEIEIPRWEVPTTTYTKMYLLEVPDWTPKEPTTETRVEEPKLEKPISSKSWGSTF